MEYYINDDDDGDIDLLHPIGRCTCFGEGRCEWCIRAAKSEDADMAESADAPDLGSGA